MDGASQPKHVGCEMIGGGVSVRTGDFDLFGCGFVA